MSKHGDDFLWICKSAYLNGIHPFDSGKNNIEQHKAIVHIGRSIIAESGISSFVGFLMEGQYRVQLWAAYLALEYGNPDKSERYIYSKNMTIVNSCIEQVEKYCFVEKNLQIKKAEEDWVLRNKKKYNLS